jgi:uncharacterized protein YacL (UPF0231 family)
MTIGRTAADRSAASAQRTEVPLFLGWDVGDIRATTSEVARDHERGHDHENYDEEGDTECGNENHNAPWVRADDSAAMVWEQWK